MHSTHAFAAPMLAPYPWMQVHDEPTQEAAQLVLNTEFPFHCESIFALLQLERLAVLANVSTHWMFFVTLPTFPVQ